MAPGARASKRLRNEKGMKMKDNRSTVFPNSNSASQTRAPRAIARLLSPDHPWLYILSAFLLTLLIESLARHSVLGGLTFLCTNPIAFFLNVGLICVTLLLALFCPKRVPMLALLAFIWFVLGMTEFILLFNRVTPLTAVDFSVFFSVLSIMDNYLKMWQIVGIIVGFILCFGGLAVLFIRAKTRRIYWKRTFVSLGALIAVVGLLLLGGFASGRISDQFSNLKDAYNDYGFEYCFLVSIVDRGVDKPDEYSKELVSGVLTSIPAPSDHEPAVQPNVILVQLESFFDATTLEGVTFSADPTPNLHRLSAQYPSGLLEVPVIGAGTVNSEFEVLTGMRVEDFGAAEYPYKSILSEATCETIAYDLLASGYRTHAIHNHEGSFYARNEVYTHLGFEDFTSIEYFKYPEYNDRDWAKDSILTDEILHLLASTEERDFVFTVSVQAHGSYPSEYVPAEGDVQVTGGVDDPAALSQLNYYLSQLYEVDAFVGALYQAIMELDEETILVFYGDHLPSLAANEAFTLSTTDKQTPYLIVANYDLDMSAATGETLYAYQLFPLTLQLIGNDEGLINRFHAARKGSEGYVNDLQTLEYDILYGEQYALETPYPVMEHMTMGTDVAHELWSATTDGDYIYVTGDHFTAFSVIAVNGIEKTTELVDEHTLRTPKGILDDLFSTPSVTVRQVNKGKVLSETAKLPLCEADTSGGTDTTADE